MSSVSISSRSAGLVCLSLFTLLLIACNAQSPAGSVAKDQAKANASQAQTTGKSGFSPEDPPPPTNRLVLPATFERHTGDLDDMVKRRNIRALILLNPIGFFYQNGLPKGAMYEFLQEFQKFTNQKMKTSAL
jgi:hypothetical protein